MAWTPETGTGATDSTVYDTLENMRLYFVAMGYAAATGATDDLTSAGYRAMAFIESQNYKGIKRTQSQALQFPRSNIHDGDGRTIPTDEIPTNLKKAWFEATREEYSEAQVLQANVSEGEVKVEKIGPLTTEFFSKNTSKVIYTIIQDYLSELVHSKANKRLVRS